MDNNLPKISFCIPVYKTKDEVERCLLSLLDQDYPNIEIICCVDGPDPEVETVIRKFPTVKMVVQEHQGACVARNTAFEHSTGDIISFFCSDHIAKPGMVSTWMNELGKHPECAFVYGAYEYRMNIRNYYPSHEFDEYLLGVANYIDSSFPIRREAVVKWDPSVKSLQDWDFWLRVVKNGHKGHFLGNEISYYADLPRPHGLSYDSKDNWIERVRYVKQKNGIPESPVCVTSYGAPHHGLEIAKMLKCDYRDDTIHKPQEYKLIYLIGLYLKPTDKRNDHSIVLGLPKKTHKLAIHWVGADIYWLRKMPWYSLKMLAGALNESVDFRFCENEQAQKELADFGIQADIMPIPVYSEWEVKPLPRQFSVGVFMTDRSDFDKYCFEMTESVIRAMPDVQFNVYGDRDTDIPLKNVKYHGNLSKEKWREFVYDNSCLLRLVKHDTLPLANCDFIMAGRNVVTNIPGKYWNVIDTGGKTAINKWDIFSEGLNEQNWPATKSTIIQTIRKIKHGKINTDYKTRVDAYDYYSDLLNKDAYRNRIYGLIEDKNAGKIERELVGTES